jgi:signal transduction histidine kinase
LRTIRRQKELLENEVAERTAQLKEKQQILEEKNQELSLLNEKKNQLLGMAAHDLRNPLTGINSYVGLLKNTIEMGLYSEKDSLADLEKITAQINRMSRLIDNILDMSAIESGKISLNIVPVNYGDILRESIAFHERVANQKKISLIATSIPLELILALDRERIMEVIDNILGNAIKYTYPGGQVTITCQAENGFVSTSISDTGQGLYEHEIDDLFTGFKKLSSKPTGGESSSGLGLAIAKKIIELHKGRIFVNSRKGEGSAFVFAIPMNLDSMKIVFIDGCT